MKLKVVVITILLINTITIDSHSQIKKDKNTFDSLHVYTLYIRSLYSIKIDKQLIKDQDEPMVVKVQSEINGIYTLLNDSIKTELVENLKNNLVDLRAYFEFYKNGKVVEEIGITPQREIFFDHQLYTYDREKLKILDRYIPSFTKEALGVYD